MTKGAGTGAGRPAIGDIRKVRMPDDLVEAVDVWAATHGVKRAEAVRALVRMGLDGTEAGPVASADPKEVFNELLGGHADLSGADLRDQIDGELGELVAGIESADDNERTGSLAVYLQVWRGAWLVEIADGQNYEYRAVRGDRAAGIELWQDTIRSLTAERWSTDDPAMWSTAERTDEHLPADLPAGSYEIDDDQ